MLNLIKSILLCNLTMSLVSTNSPISFATHNVCSEKKNTKRSSNTLPRLVFFFSERTLQMHDANTRGENIA